MRDRVGSKVLNTPPYVKLLGFIRRGCPFSIDVAKPFAQTGIDSRFNTLNVPATVLLVVSLGN